MRIARLTPFRTLSKFRNKSRTSPSRFLDQSPFYTLDDECRGERRRSGHLTRGVVTTPARSPEHFDACSAELDPPLQLRVWNDLCYIFSIPPLE